eukprot:SAG31_NODE_972_length_10644_cov_3.435372_6_plen_55_part_00
MLYPTKAFDLMHGDREVQMFPIESLGYTGSWAWWAEPRAPGAVAPSIELAPSRL